MIERARKRLTKRTKRGFHGWPLATVALYGPDDTTATKLTVGIVPSEDAEATEHALSLCNALVQAACPIAFFIGDLKAGEQFVARLLDSSEKHELVPCTSGAVALRVSCS